MITANHSQRTNLSSALAAYSFPGSSMVKIGVDFYIGQHVICICDQWSNEPTWRAAVQTYPKLGGIYTIRDICPRVDLIGLLFEEIWHEPAMFCLARSSPHSTLNASGRSEKATSTFSKRYSNRHPMLLWAHNALIPLRDAACPHKLEPAAFAKAAHPTAAATTAKSTLHHPSTGCGAAAYSSASEMLRRRRA